MAHKREEVAARLRPVRGAELDVLARQKRTGKAFGEALATAKGLGIIAEIKRKSPSAGQIAVLPDPTEQARKYYNAGTDCISVLTDEKYFGGTIRDLWDVYDLLGRRDDAPALIRKDFFVHPIQVVEAAEAGARAILIIVRALTDDEMKALYETASRAGLDSLFEVHEECEIERALKLSPKIIGVNNRDLARFRTDIGISERLIPQIPKGIVTISESGIATPEDAARAKACGARALLVGEALMKADDPEKLLEQLKNA